MLGNRLKSLSATAIRVALAREFPQEAAEGKAEKPQRKVVDFSGRHTNPHRNAERRLTKAIGSRQARRQAKAKRLAKREEKLYRLHDEAIQVRFEEARHAN